MRPYRRVLRLIVWRLESACRSITPSECYSDILVANGSQRSRLCPSSCQQGFHRSASLALRLDAPDDLDPSYMSVELSIQADALSSNTGLGGIAYLDLALLCLPIPIYALSLVSPRSVVLLCSYPIFGGIAMRRERRWLTAAIFMAMSIGLLSGCTSLFTDLGIDPLTKPQEIVETMSLADRIAYRAAFESPHYREISRQIRPGSRPYIERPSMGVQTVVFSLELQDTANVTEDFRVYPYAMFLFDPSSRELIEVYRVTPVLSEHVLIIESLTEDETYTEAMSECVAAELESARFAAHARAGNGRLNPKDYLCDPDATSPYGLCWCEEVVAPHYDLDCLDVCLLGCTALPSPYNTLCIGVCYASCWVPEYCADYECTTIYPCNWPT